MRRVTLLPTSLQRHSAPFNRARHSTPLVRNRIAYVSVNQRLRNIADIFCIAYELVDNWYRSIIGFVRYTLRNNAGPFFSLDPITQPS